MSNQKKSRKNIREKNLVRMVESGDDLVRVEIHQQQPYTHAVLKYYAPSYPGGVVVSHGFSKKHQNDEWSVTIGKRVAIKRAIRNMAIELTRFYDGGLL